MKHARLIELALTALSVALAVALAPSSESQELQLPRRNPRPDYLGSEGCQMCHQSEYASWHRSYHRTMTRRPDQVDWDGAGGPALPAVLEDEHFSFRLVRREAGIIAEGPDLHVAAQKLYGSAEEAKREGSAQPSARAIERALEQVPRATRRVALVTGSHHYLAFWLENGDERELRQLPFVYHLDEKKWAARSEAFLEPPDAPPYIATWNSNCIQCHAVAGEPGEREWRDEHGVLHVRYRSRVAELGIACEACHGPGRQHADHYRNPLSRWKAGKPAAFIVNPGELDRTAGSAICGQCHAYFVPRDEGEFWERGYSAAFIPGQLRAGFRVLLSPSHPDTAGPSLSRELDSIFWPDGTMRVGGREYAGLLESACYSKGSGQRQLGCTSCHSMHASEPNDQLSAEAAESPNAPCADCHTMKRDHSGHAPGSIGDSCVNCHMPKTSYALLQALRSHRIQVPDPSRSDVPSACALCHIDRPLAWFTAVGAPAARTDPAGDLDSVGVGVRGALAGNAAERAIYAAALASPETRATVGDALTRALLERATRDPYHAVRRIAERGLESFPPAGDAPSPLAAELVLRLEAARDERDVVISE